jgi:hypothetical protein
LCLPIGFGLGIPGVKIDDPTDIDSYLSSWYRGKRYGYAQQSVYVPLLKQYCQKYKRNGDIVLNQDTNIKLHQDSENGISW